MVKAACPNGCLCSKGIIKEDPFIVMVKNRPADGLTWNTDGDPGYLIDGNHRRAVWMQLVCTVHNIQYDTKQ